MGEVETYKIGRITYTQSELTLKKDFKLIEMYNSLISGPLKDQELRLKDLQVLLTRQNRLNYFFGIILKPKIDAAYIISFKWIGYARGMVAIGEISNSLLVKIFDDFFLFNKALITKLSELGNILELMPTGPTDQETKTAS